MPLFGPPNVEKLKAQRNVNGLIKALGYRKDEPQQDKNKSTAPRYSGLMPPDLVRRLAAEALGQIGDIRALEPLKLAAIGDHNESVRLGAISALTAIVLGTSAETAQRGRALEMAVEVLELKLKDSSSLMRLRAAEALEQIGDLRAVEPLIKRLRAAEALGQIGDLRAVEPLINMIAATGSRYQRETAVKALIQIAGTHAVDPLVALLVTFTFRVNGYHVIVPIAESLERLSWQPDNELQRISFAFATAGNEMKGLGIAAIEPLINALTAENHQLRELAAKALGKLQDRRAVEPLLATLNDDEPPLWFPNRFTVRGRVDAYPEQEAVQGILRTTEIQVAKENRYPVREAAVEALAQIGDLRAVEPLTALLATCRNESLMKVVVQALGKLGDPQAVDSLLVLLEGATVLFRCERDENESFLCEEVAKALGQIGDVRGVRPLLALASGNQASSVAIQALQKVLERNAEGIAPTDLRSVAALKNMVQFWLRASDCWNNAWAYQIPVDCTYVRQLARQELIRRGLEA